MRNRLLIAILLIILLAGISLVYLNKDSKPLGIIGPIEVPMYYEDKNDQSYFKVRKDGTETEITKDEYKGIELKQGEKAYSMPKLKLTQLKDGEYYKTGKTDAGSTTPEVIFKQSGIESIKMLTEL